MARSGHRCQPEAMGSPDGDAGAGETVCAAFDADDGACGRRRTRDEPEARGRVVGERRVRRMMAEERPGARGRARPKRGHGSCEGEASGHPGNKAGRDFEAGLPDFPWPAGVTQFSMPAGRPRLSPVPDRFDGAVAGWTTSASPNAEMASSMPGAALDATADHGRRHLAIRSDRGCHCRRPGWTGICEEAGMARSMSRRGRSPDDSGMGGLFGTMKTEAFRGGDWAGVALDELGKGVGAYMERRNTTGTKRSLGSMSPPRYRRSLGLAA